MFTLYLYDSFCTHQDRDRPHPPQKTIFCLARHGSARPHAFFFGHHIIFEHLWFGDRRTLKKKLKMSTDDIPYKFTLGVFFPPDIKKKLEMSTDDLLTNLPLTFFVLLICTLQQKKTFIIYSLLCIMYSS